jgi:hypothetical protein
MQWVKNSIDVHQGNGSAAYYSRLLRPLNPWAKAYPETTGYLLNTLLDYKEEEAWIDTYVDRCTDWLCKIQYPSGAFPALYADSGKPSIFNTGMILFGLTASYQHRPKNNLLLAIENAVQWLLDQLGPDHLWSEETTEKGRVPSYYTRVIWAILEANLILAWKEIPDQMQQVLDVIRSRCLENGAVGDWGFEARRPAYTHTIAYTLRGFWEAGRLLHDHKAVRAATKGMNALEDAFFRAGKLAGEYDLRWQGDHRYVCVPGNLQLACLAYRINRPDFGAGLIQQVLGTQQMDPEKGNYGGLPGSWPVYGPYMRFKYPNWGPKFLLDALRLAGAHAPTFHKM